MMTIENIKTGEWDSTSTSTENAIAAAETRTETTGHLCYKCAAVRIAQYSISALLAYGLYQLNHWAGGGVSLLAASGATSSLVYLGLAMQSRTGKQAVLNLLAVPVLFTTAYAGAFVAAQWLIVSFLLHGCIAAVQVSSFGNSLRGGMFSWSIFNSALALYLLMA